MSIDPNKLLQLESALAKWPRVELGHLPTPIDSLPRLSERYAGVEFEIKRDDCTGLAMGGNKVRQLEYYLGDAMANGCDSVLSTGAVQSNYMRTLAAAAARVGLECHIQLESRVQSDTEDYQHSGNVFLDHLFGAHIHTFDEGENEFGADASIQEIAEQLKRQGKSPYIVPLAPVSQPKGALGYVRAALELAKQFQASNHWPDIIVVGSGSSLTHAGLLTGLRQLGIGVRVVGACVRRGVEQQHPRVLDTCGKVESMLGLSGCVTEEDVEVSDVALSPGYGQASDRVMLAIREMAQTEGILLDPVYSGKAVSCTLQLAEMNQFVEGSKILMIHTGGTPALFAYRSQILSSTAFSL